MGTLILWLGGVVSTFSLKLAFQTIGGKCDKNKSLHKKKSSNFEHDEKNFSVRWAFFQKEDRMTQRKASEWLALRQKTQLCENGSDERPPRRTNMATRADCPLNKKKKSEKRVAKTARKEKKRQEGRPSNQWLCVSV